MVLGVQCALWYTRCAWKSGIILKLKMFECSRLAIVRMKPEANVYGERKFIESEVRHEMAKWDKVSFIFYSEESFLKKLNEWMNFKGTGRMILIQFLNGQKCWKWEYNEIISDVFFLNFQFDEWHTTIRFSFHLLFEIHLSAQLKHFRSMDIRFTKIIIFLWWNNFIWMNWIDFNSSRRPILRSVGN